MALANVYPVDLTSARYEQADPTAQFLTRGGSQDNQGGMWKYAKASGAISAFQACTISSALTPLAVPATTTTIVSAPYTTGTPGCIGVPMIDVADTNFAWFWCGGPGCGGVGSGIKILLAASTTAETKLYTTGTAGVLSSTLVSVSLIQGVKATVATTPAAAIEVISTQYLTVNCQD